MLRVAICSDVENIVFEYATLHNIKVDLEVFYTGESLIDFIKY